MTNPPRGSKAQKKTGAMTILWNWLRTVSNEWNNDARVDILLPISEAEHFVVFHSSVGAIIVMAHFVTTQSTTAQKKAAAFEAPMYKPTHERR